MQKKYIPPTERQARKSKKVKKLIPALLTLIVCAGIGLGTYQAYANDLFSSATDSSIKMPFILLVAVICICLLAAVYFTGQTMRNFDDMGNRKKQFFRAIKVNMGKNIAFALVAVIAITALFKKGYVQLPGTTRTITRLNDEYLAEVTDGIESDIYDNLDKYIVNYVTNNDITEYLSDDAVADIADQAADILAANGMSDEQKSEVTTMISDFVADYDWSNVLTNVNVSLTEDTKAYITNEIAKEVEKSIANANFSITDEEKLEIKNSVLDSLRGDINQMVADAVANSGAQTTVSYTLSDSDVELIKNAVINSIDLSGLTNSDVDINTLVSQIVTQKIDELVAQGLKGADGYTPQKGTDYFTEDDVNNIVEQVLAKTSGYELTDEDKNNIVNTVSTTVMERVEGITDNLAGQIKDNQAKIDELNTAIGTLRSDMANLSGTNTGDIAALKEKIDNLTAQLTDAQGNQFNISSYNTYVTNTDTRISSLETEQGTLKDTVTNLTKDVNDRLDELEGLLSGDDGLRKAFQEFKASTESTLAALNTSVSTIENTKIPDIDARISEINDLIGDVDLSQYQKVDENGDLVYDADGNPVLGTDDVAGVLESLQAQIGSFEGQYDTKISDLEKSISDVTGEIGNKNETLYKDYTGSMWEAIAALKTSIGEKSNLDTALADKNLVEIANLFYTHLNTIDSQIATINTSLSGKLDVSAFETYKSQVASSLSNLQAQISSNDTDIANLQSAWKSFKGTSTLTLANIQSSLDSLQSQIASNDADIATLNSNLTGLSVTDTLTQTINQGLYRFEQNAISSPNSKRSGTIITTAIAGDDISGTIFSTRLCVLDNGNIYTSYYKKGSTYGSWKIIRSDLDTTLTNLKENSLCIKNDNSQNLIHGCMETGFYGVSGSETGHPLSGYGGNMITLNNGSYITKIVYLVNNYTYIMSQKSTGEIISSWKLFTIN